MTIQEKLARIQLSLKAPKNQFNSFGKYHYRSCEDILEAAKPIVNSMGCTVTLSDSVIEVGGRLFLAATAWFGDAEGGSIVVNAMAEIPAEKKGMDASQITGAASSYARKYALQGLFLLDDNKDADAREPDEKRSYTATAQPEPYPETSPYKCAECGDEIVPYTGTNGKAVSVKKHADASMKKYGRTLCINCIRDLEAKKSEE